MSIAAGRPNLPHAPLTCEDKKGEMTDTPCSSPPRSPPLSSCHAALCPRFVVYCYFYRVPKLQMQLVVFKLEVREKVSKSFIVTSLELTFFVLPMYAKHTKF